MGNEVSSDGRNYSSGMSPNSYNKEKNSDNSGIGSGIPRIGLQQSVSFDGGAIPRQRRVSHHYCDYSLFPDRFDYPAPRSRSLSTGSAASSNVADNNSASSSVTEIQQQQRSAAQENAQKSSRTRYTSAPPRYNFFDYSLYPDKDPKSVLTKR